MSLVSLNTIKSYFARGKYPTSQQFGNTFDSFRHKSVNVPINEVDGLGAALLLKADVEYVNGLLGGSGAQTVTYVTHTQLLELISDGDLIEGAYYRITDFKTKHKIPYTEDINTGILETLICFATSETAIDKQVYSGAFPKDIIYYDVFDTSCEDGTWDTSIQKYTGGTPRKGKITYRKDTVRELECYYDWRNVKFRRWAVDAAEWSYSSSYSKFDVCKSLIDGCIYICKSAIENSSLDPASFSECFQKMFNLSDNNFISWTPIADNFNIGNIKPDNLIINDVTAGTDYKDFYTFTILNELENSTGITSQNKGYFSYKICSIIDLSDGYNNIVFFLGSSDKSYSNVFEQNCGSSTVIANQFNANVFKNDSLNNYIDRIFYSNNVGSNCCSNVFGFNSYSNTFGNDYCLNVSDNGLSSNIFGAGCSKNIFGQGFLSNRLGYLSIESVFGSSTYNNIFGVGFSFNICGNDLSSNTFGNGCSSNTFGDVFISNLFGDNCFSNSLQSYCRFNKFGSNFQSNIIANESESNSFGENCLSNSFGTGLNLNTFGNDFSNNDLDDFTIHNKFGNNISYLSLDLGAKYNNFKGVFAGIEFDGINFISDLYEPYNCDIITASDAKIYLIYFDGSEYIFTLVSPEPV